MLVNRAKLTFKSGENQLKNAKIGMKNWFITNFWLTD